MRWGFTAPGKRPAVSICWGFSTECTMYILHVELIAWQSWIQVWISNFHFFFLNYCPIAGNSNNHITTTLILFPLSPLLPPSQILGQKDREKFTSLSVLFFLPSLPVCLRFSSCLFVSACSSLVAVSCPVSVRRISVLLERYKSSSVLPAKTQQSSFEIQPTATSVYIEQILAQNHPILNLPSRIITSHPDFAFQ